jgi:hypothetical protein
MRKKRLVLVLLSMVLPVACTKEPVQAVPGPAPAPVVAAEPDIDPVTGFKMAGDWELVRGNCTACHSAKLITQQRGTAEQWLAMIRWMQKKQNLWQFDPGTENRIIAYLSENYPPDAARRRAAIPPDLMPPNPYTPETTSLD